MKIYRVSFFGHRALTSVRETEDKIERLAKELMQKNDFVEFYVGRNGDYDIYAASAVKRAQKAIGSQNSALVLVLPYAVKDVEYYKDFYDEVILPLGCDTHFKNAISKRNEWMIENSDLVVAFVQKKYGGAHSALRYAEKQGVEIINLSIRET